MCVCVSPLMYRYIHIHTVCAYINKYRHICMYIYIWYINIQKLQYRTNTEALVFGLALRADHAGALGHTPERLAEVAAAAHEGHLAAQGPNSLVFIHIHVHRCIYVRLFFQFTCEG